MRTARTVPPPAANPVTWPAGPVRTVTPRCAAAAVSWLISGPVSRYPSAGNQATPGPAAGRRSAGSSAAASAGPIIRAGYPQLASRCTRAVSWPCPAAVAAHSRFPAGRYHAAPPSSPASTAQARIPAWLSSW